MSVKNNLQFICTSIPQGVKLIIVSKTKSTEKIMQAYEAGHRAFGESRVKEIINKKPQLPDDIEWNFIGHLQTNKIKHIATFVSMIHSVDSFRLLIEINKKATEKNKVINCLLQFYIATEESKYGFDIKEVRQMLQTKEFKTLMNIRICGVMGMATFTNDTALIRQEFSSLKKIFDTLKHEFFSNDEYFKEISMGMSNDYFIAIEEGSTMVRIGNAIFETKN